MLCRGPAGCLKAVDAEDNRGMKHLAWMYRHTKGSHQAGNHARLIKDAAGYVLGLASRQACTAGTYVQRARQKLLGM